MRRLGGGPVLARLATILVAVSLPLSLVQPAHADLVPGDGAKAVSAVPPGESGFIPMSDFAADTASGNYGAHFADQLQMYSAFHYKPMQFEARANCTSPGGRTGVCMFRDSYGVPVIYAGNEGDLWFAFGYAMAQDRLFQMEALRRVGHGTLADITGPANIPMDVGVRRVSEGPTLRMQEFNAAAAAKPYLKTDGQAFADGINASMTDQCGPSVGGMHTAFAAFPTTCPAEFTLLNDTPSDWTIDDTLAFGEYAGRFFGQFGGDELAAARQYLNLVTKLGQAEAEKTFNDFYRLQDPTAPSIVHPEDGTFPRHTGPAAPVPGGFSGSQFVNHDTALLGDPPALALAQTQLASELTAVQRLRIPDHFGSNAIAVSGAKTADGNPILYSGPQTGWAVPGFFWEAELHDPERDERGVAVPAIPLLVIGRNSDSGFAVTSGLDGNVDTFVEQLNATHTASMHNGTWAPLQSHQETVPCHVPPSAAAGILGVPPTLPSPCPVPDTTITVWRTIHGQGLVDQPDSNNRLFVRQSSVDNHLVETLDAWDLAGRQHTAADFGQALSGLYVCFNFFYADAKGEIAYFHTGRLPIRPSNVDPTLPLPGDGPYDWQGYEAWSDMPHVINPQDHYLVNWNNKPAQGWWSKESEVSYPLAGPETGDRWGAEHHIVPLDAIVRGGSGFTLDSIGQVPKQVAYIDNRARVFMPSLLAALNGTSDATLTQVRAALAAWDQQRYSTDGSLHTAPTFFDRWFEHLQHDVLRPAFSSDKDYNAAVGLNDPNVSQNGHYVSTENQDTPTFKFAHDSYETLLDVFRTRTQHDFLGAAGLTAGGALLQAAQEAVAELTASSGSDPAKWSEPVEQGAFSPQGGGSVPAISPLENRGSYAQVIEPLAAATTMTPNTATGGPLPVLLILGTAGFGAALAARRRRGRRTIIS